MNFSLPHKYVAMPAWVILSAFQVDPPKRALLGSYSRLLSLSWDRSDKSTPIMPEEACYEFLRVSRRQFFEIIKEMEGLRWLRSDRPRIGFVQFFFHGDDPALVTQLVDNSASAENFTAGANNRTEVRKTALESELIGGGESLINNLNTDSIPPTLKSENSAKNRTKGFPSAVEILAQTPLLFDGAVVISKGLETRESLDVLGWCAYAYSQKDRMTGPGGVVRNRLLENQRPIEWTKHRWQETLPADFLEALGVIHYECDVCRQSFEHRAELEEHKKAHPIFAICERCSKKFETNELLDAHWEEAHPMPAPLQPDDSVTQRLNNGETLSPAQAWQSVLSQLQVDMPRAAFVTWVQHTQAVRYGGNVLKVAVANQYAADWLENRLTSTVERLLIGILNAEVHVEFVVSEMADAS